MSKENMENEIRIPLTEAEQELLAEKLLRLLADQANRYNGPDSTSMSVDAAEKLFSSLLYTIKTAIAGGMTKEEVLSTGLGLVIENGRDILREKRQSAKIDFDLMLWEPPVVRNAFYVDTMKNLELFFRKYEIRYAAHQIPCSIDYPLLCPVSEEEQGISYVEAYIKNLQIETDLIRSFSPEKIALLYRAFCPTYREFYFNLCDPILANAIGLELIGADCRVLSVNPADRERLAERILFRDPAEVKTMVEAAVRNVCGRIGMAEPFEISYFSSASESLSVRLSGISEKADLAHVFYAF